MLMMRSVIKTVAVAATVAVGAVQLALAPASADPVTGNCGFEPWDIYAHEFQCNRYGEFYTPPNPLPAGKPGDLIRHELIVQPGPGQTLDPGSVPAAGPVNRWLDLRRTQLLERSEHRIRILLEYQVFYAPLTVKNLAVPGYTLRFQDNGGSTGREVPPWTFSMAPIHGLAVLDSDAAEPVRGDAWPSPPAASTAAWRMTAHLAIAGSALLAFAYFRGWLGRDPRGRAFRDAHQALRRLHYSGSGQEILRQAFTTVHRAFDSKLGEPLFAERLPEFLQTNPQFRGLATDIEEFFAASYDLFFGTGDIAAPKGPNAASPYGIDRLKALSLACLNAERNSG